MPPEMGKIEVRIEENPHQSQFAYAGLHVQNAFAASARVIGTGEDLTAMSETTSQRDFVKHFAGRMIPFTRMGAGHARQLAETVNEAQGRGDASLHTDAELGALFVTQLRETTVAPPLNPEATP